MASRVVVIRPGADRHDVVDLHTFMPKATKIDQIQALVGGTTYARLPHRMKELAGLVAYTNYADAGPHPLAHSMLTSLRFITRDGDLYGVVVLSGANGRALSDKAIVAIDKAYAKYLETLEEDSS
jgi:hypothetical protein